MPVEVLEEGRAGRGVGTFLVTSVNGEIESRALIGRWIEREPVTELVLSPPESMYAGTTDVPGAVGDTQAGLATWYDPPWSGLTAAHPDAAVRHAGDRDRHRDRSFRYRHDR